MSGVDLDLIFLGTSGSVPTAQRAPSALLIRRGGERMLFDCGEGTQRQLLCSTIGLPELPEVFVSHFHADHYLGLPGMLKTFALRGRELPLTVYGPRGLKDLFATLRRVFGRLPYGLELVELAPGDVLERGEYNLVTFPVAHAAESIGFALVGHPRAGPLGSRSGRPRAEPRPRWSPRQPRPCPRGRRRQQDRRASPCSCRTAASSRLTAC